MTLRTDLKLLRELEQRAEPGWIRGESGNIYCRKCPDRYPLMMPYGINANSAEVQLSVDLRNHAPTMLSVLECFGENDSEYISRIRDDYETLISMGVIVEIPVWLDDLLKRHQKAASLMEGKGDD